MECVAQMQSTAQTRNTLKLLRLTTNDLHAIMTDWSHTCWSQREAFHQLPRAWEDAPSAHSGIFWLIHLLFTSAASPHTYSKHLPVAQSNLRCVSSSMEPQRGQQCTDDSPTCKSSPISSVTRYYDEVSLAIWRKILTIADSSFPKIL